VPWRTGLGEEVSDLAKDLVFSDELPLSGIEDILDELPGL
jgi:hypothetical protein